MAGPTVRSQTPEVGAGWTTVQVRICAGRRGNRRSYRDRGAGAAMSSLTRPRSMLRCRSSTRGSLGCLSTLRGRPGLRFGFAVFGAFGAGFSRALITVESREMCPTRCSPTVPSTNASCSWAGRELSATYAKAREKVATLGIARTEVQPQRGRIFSSSCSRSIKSRVIKRLKAAFARNACARETRFFAGRSGHAPNPIILSTSTNSNTLGCSRHRSPREPTRSSKAASGPVEIHASNAIECVPGILTPPLQSMIWFGSCCTRSAAQVARRTAQKRLRRAYR